MYVGGTYCQVLSSPGFDDWSERRTQAMREVSVDRRGFASESVLDRQTARLLACLLLFETMFLLGVMVWM
jgi:hypothetical protein